MISRNISITIILILWSTISYSQNYSLDSCKTLALENNKRLKEAKLKLQASEQVKKDAFTKYFPQIKGNGAFIKSSGDLIEVSVEGGNLPVYDGNISNLANASQFAYFPGLALGLDYANILSVTAVQPIYAGSQIRNGNLMAKTGIQIYNDVLNLTEEEIKLKTEELFWTLISLKEKMNTIISYQSMLDTLQIDVEVAYEAGLIYKSDLLKVKLKKNELLTNKLQLQNGIDIVTMSLCQHIGVKYSSKITFSDNINLNTPPYEYITNVTEKANSRTEIQILEKNKYIEDLKYKLRRGENMPQLAVGIGGLYSDLFDNSNTNVLAFATLSIPISDWWGGCHKMKEQKINIDIVQNKLDETKELLVLDITKNSNDLKEAFERIEVAKNSKEEAFEHYKVMKDNYSAGLISTSDLLEAQAMLQNSRAIEIDALSNYKIRLAHYLKSIGDF